MSEQQKPVRELATAAHVSDALDPALRELELAVIHAEGNEEDARLVLETAQRRLANVRALKQRHTAD